MSKSEWSQERTDRLVEGIMGWKIVSIMQYGLTTKHWEKSKGNVSCATYLINPTTDLNDAFMLVESEWFRSKYYICITNANGQWWVTVHINCGIVASESIDESLPLAICLALEKLEV